MIVDKSNKSMNKNDIEIYKNLIYLKQMLVQLSLSYEEQLNSVSDVYKWNLPNDIVSSWENYEQVVDNLFNAKIIDKDAIDKFEVIVNNFDEASLGSENYEEIIWSLEGLKNHRFWQNQRKRAKELLIILNENKHDE